jgi:hypothetical protein
MKQVAPAAAGGSSAAVGKQVAAFFFEGWGTIGAEAGFFLPIVRLMMWPDDVERKLRVPVLSDGSFVYVH